MKRALSYSQTQQFKMKTRKKAQMNSIDAFFALSIFIIILVLFTVTLNNYNYKLSERVDYDNMVAKAFQISDLLVKNEGRPVDWGATNITAEIIGIASEDRVLSETKINRLRNLSVNQTKSIFKIYGNNFYISLKNSSGGNITSYGNPFNQSSSKKVVNIKRYVLYNNASTILEFSIWK